MRRPTFTRTKSAAEKSKSSDVDLLDVTGRYLLRFSPKSAFEVTADLQAAGFRVADSRDSKVGAFAESDLADVDVLMMPDVGTALVSGEDNQLERLTNGTRLDMVAIEPERVLRGFAILPQSIAEGADWGVGAVRASSSPFSGAGVRVAVLDSGLDLTHADFVGRVDVASCFAFTDASGSVQDHWGHGTHCAGIIAGPQHPAGAPRYSVAPDAELWVGKVVTDDGHAAEGTVVAGFQWAVTNRCAVVCMALARRVATSQPFPAPWEQRAGLALQQGSLPIAAVGNDSFRPSVLAPVAEPANAPSVFGATGVASSGLVFREANRALNFPGAGTIDLAGPGVHIGSAVPGGYGTADGTSMGAAFICGVATLWRQAFPDMSAIDLGRTLIKTALNLPGPGADVGAGLVQAPQ